MKSFSLQTGLLFYAVAGMSIVAALAMMATMNFLWLALAIGGGIYCKRLWRERLPTADEVRKTDARPPVLYLRSFEDEKNDFSFQRALEGVVAPRSLPGSGSNPYGTPEMEQFCGVLKCAGPLIGLARVDEKLQDVGAAWSWVESEHWQSEVIRRLQESIGVVFRAGHTEGLRWELEYLTGNYDPKRMLLMLPPWQRAYDEFLQWAAPLFPQGLPKKLPSSRLVIFDQDWTVTPLKSTEDAFASLHPFFAQNGIAFPRSHWEAAKWQKADQAS
ncbi:MAG: hypothetical protein AAF191_09540 [Verrucomicrobiota bacterium]